MYHYTPFKNPLKDIDFEDLLLLKDVSESWYLDYKSNELKISDYAKHLSAFANQFGGWLIIGVEESNDGTKSAGKFTGVENSKVERICTQIREASSVHSNPEVFYEEKIIRGSIPEIGLDKDRSIIIIGIPQSMNAPHIHKTGRVYTRISDQSKPKEITDRYEMDKLYERSEKHHEKISNFLTSLPNLPEMQKNSPFLHVYYKLPDNQSNMLSNLTFDNFKSIVLNEPALNRPSLAKLETISTMHDGFIARQAENNHPTHHTLTLRWFRSGVIRIDIPLETFNVASFTNAFSETDDVMKAKRYGRKLLEYVDDTILDTIKIIDYSKLISYIYSMSSNVFHIFKSINANGDILSCLTIRNVENSFPYYNNDYFLSKVENEGVPKVFDNIISMPFSPDDFSMRKSQIELSSIDLLNKDDVNSSIISIACTTALDTLIANGVLSDLENIDEINSYLYG